MFLIHSVLGGYIPPLEFKPAAAITPKVGLALYETDGKLAVATGTTKPTYIAMTEKDSAITAGDIIPVIKANPDIVFETENSTTQTAKQGQAVTVDSNGQKVTATTTSGVATIVDMDGTAQGDKIRVRFL